MLVSEVKGEAQLVSRNELRYFFATRSNQTIYYARVMDSRPPDANAMMEYASLRLLAGDSAGYKRSAPGWSSATATPPTERPH